VIADDIGRNREREVEKLSRLSIQVRASTF
jgi:hypothetical protein